MVNRAGGFLWKVCNELKGAPARVLEIGRRLDPRMSTGAIVHGYLGSIAAQVNGQSRRINLPTENRLTDYQNHLARTLTMWKILVRCYVTLTST